MDLIATLRDKIDALQDGEYVPGLRAVLLHVETAFRHLSRGRKEGDETAFTDAIYRTNQAFEGSIKEAFRVLAGQDPAKMKPFEIESYLEKNGVFRARVMRQFTNYRTEWRNPSTHDYKLGFDESEAFLAIVSVTAFACLLLDEISEKLSYLKSKADTESQQESLQKRISPSETDLVSELIRAIQEFTSRHQAVSDVSRESEAQIMGALHGFLTAALPGVQVTTEVQLVPNRPFRVDFFLQRGDETVILDVKRRFFRKNYQNALAQVEHYMLLGDVKNGILLFLPEKACELTLEEYIVRRIGARMIILKPGDEA